MIYEWKDVWTVGGVDSGTWDLRKWHFESWKSGMWGKINSDINVLEAMVLCNALSSFYPSIRNARVDVWTENTTLHAAWKNGGYKSPLANQEMRKIEGIS